MQKYLNHLEFNIKQDIRQIKQFCATVWVKFPHTTAKESAQFKIRYYTSIDRIPPNFLNSR
jgi:hypothetical protein